MARRCDAAHALQQIQAYPFQRQQFRLLALREQYRLAGPDRVSIALFQDNVDSMTPIQPREFL